jgi:hypothetical protein
VNSNEFKARFENDQLEGARQRRADEANSKYLESESLIASAIILATEQITTAILDAADTIASGQTYPDLADMLKQRREKFLDAAKALGIKIV